MPKFLIQVALRWRTQKPRVTPGLGEKAPSTADLDGKIGRVTCSSEEQIPRVIHSSEVGITELLIARKQQ